MKKKEDVEESGKSSTKKAKMVKKKVLSKSSSANDQIVDVEEDDKSNTIPVDHDQHYSEDRDLHITATGSNFIHISLESLGNFDDDGGQKTTTSTPLGKRKRSSTSACSVIENIEPVLPVPFLCEICFETKSANKSFTINGCDHSYCSDCMSKYVATKLEENVTRIVCPVPDCKQGLLDPEYCRSILPPLVFDRWGYALCEVAIPVSDKFYCPFKDCSALLSIEKGKLEIVNESNSSSECPNCKRMFCLRCKVPWHESITCEEFKKLADETAIADHMLMDLAQSNQWRRCPNCHIFVEKSRGCMFLKCRCGIRFCYECGQVRWKRTSNILRGCTCSRPR